MPDEGKLSRAMAKAAGAEQRSETSPKEAAAPTASAASHFEAAKPAEIRRSGECWGKPHPTVLLYHERASAFASQIRSLRAKLLASSNGSAPRVITITSGSRAEGKSTVTANLAGALGEIHAGRVAVIDGDTLRPTLGELLNINAPTGLEEILRENLALDGNVYETALPNVDLIPSRMDEKDVLESLMHQNCQHLLAKLRKHYSYVLIDTPPVLAGSQAALFGKFSDGVILVARLEKTPRQVVTRASHELTNAGCRMLGCVLTHHRHHVPNFIYRFFGTTPAYYYRYGRQPERQKTN